MDAKEVQKKSDFVKFREKLTLLQSEPNICTVIFKEIS